jgi:hypothetical protein
MSGKLGTESAKVKIKMIASPTAPLPAASLTLPATRCRLPAGYDGTDSVEVS